MLAIFPCVCCPSVGLLWRNVCLCLLPIFQMGCLLFCYWVIWDVCILLEINPLLVVSFANIPPPPPPFSRFSFCFVYGFLWVTSFSLFTFMHWRRKWRPIPVFLPWESQGLASLVGCPLWGWTESDTTEAT